MTRRQEGLTFSSPGPSLHITAAATALTTFINVSRQPESRKRRHKEFLQKVHAPLKPCENGRFVIAALSEESFRVSREASGGEESAAQHEPAATDFFFYISVLLHVFT